MITNEKKIPLTNIFSFSTLVVVLSFVIYQSKWQQKVDEHIVSFERHQVNKTLHMPLQDKINLFVPRVELDNRLKNIEELLKDLKTELKKTK